MRIKSYMNIPSPLGRRRWRPVFFTPHPLRKNNATTSPTKRRGKTRTPLPLTRCVKTAQRPLPQRGEVKQGLLYPSPAA
jgi:hypothetical protein